MWETLDQHNLLFTFSKGFISKTLQVYMSRMVNIWDLGLSTPILKQ